MKRAWALAAGLALLSGCAALRGESSDPKANRAISVTTAAIKDIDRYTMHTAEGEPYAATARPLTKEEAKPYSGPPPRELWRVDYELEKGPADQGIHFIVDLLSSTIVKTWMDGV